MIKINIVDGLVKVHDGRVRWAVVFAIVADPSHSAKRMCSLLEPLLGIEA